MFRRFGGLSLAYCALVEVPEGEVGGVFCLAVVGQHQVCPRPGHGGGVKGQQGGPVFQGVEVVLRGHAKHAEVVSKVGANHHLEEKRRSGKEV